MKKLFIVFILLTSMTAKAQREYNITNQDLYKLIQNELSFWKWNVYDILNDSKCNIESINPLSSEKYAIQPVSRKTFHDKNTSIVQVPEFDSTGELIGSKKVESKKSVSGIFCNKEMAKQMKIGLIFSIGTYTDEDYDLNNENSFIIINPKELDVFKTKQKSLFFEMLTSLDFNFDSCMSRKYNINGKETKLYIWPTTSLNEDTIGFIQELTDKIFNNYNADFNKTYYTQGIPNFFINEDKYGNSYFSSRPAERDTINIYDVKTEQYNKTSVLKTLENRELRSISICFSKDLTTNKTDYHVGAKKDIYTSSGVNLGGVNYFLKSEDALKTYSETSRALIRFLYENYQ